MSTIIPEGDALKKAIKWIAEERQQNPNHSATDLANAAAVRFDLPPKDADFLFRFIREGSTQTP